MADAEEVRRAKILLDDLSQTPRFAGSPEEAQARARCRKELESAGFACREMPFDYSQWPGRWGPPIAALIQAATIVVVGHMAVHSGPLCGTRGRRGVGERAHAGVGRCQAPLDRAVAVAAREVGEPGSQARHSDGLAGCAHRLEIADRAHAASDSELGRSGSDHSSWHF